MARRHGRKFECFLKMLLKIESPSPSECLFGQYSRMCGSRCENCRHNADNVYVSQAEDGKQKIRKKDIKKYSPSKYWIKVNREMSKYIHDGIQDGMKNPLSLLIEGIGKEGAECAEGGKSY